MLVLLSTYPAYRTHIDTLAHLRPDTNYPTLPFYVSSSDTMVYIEKTTPWDVSDIEFVAQVIDISRAYILDIGYAIDATRRPGDVVLPTVAFVHSDTAEVLPYFLPFYDEQKDYMVEDYGLSVGGICVWAAPDISQILVPTADEYALADTSVKKRIGNLHTDDEYSENPLLQKLSIRYVADVYVQSIPTVGIYQYMIEHIGKLRSIVGILDPLLVHSVDTEHLYIHQKKLIANILDSIYLIESEESGE